MCILQAKCICKVPCTLHTAQTPCLSKINCSELKRQIQQNSLFLPSKKGRNRLMRQTIAVARSSGRELLRALRTQSTPRAAGSPERTNVSSGLKILQCCGTTISRAFAHLVGSLRTQDLHHVPTFGAGVSNTSRSSQHGCCGWERIKKPPRAFLDAEPQLHEDKKPRRAQIKKAGCSLCL